MRKLAVCFRWNKTAYSVRLFVCMAVWGVLLHALCGAAWGGERFKGKGADISVEVPEGWIPEGSEQEDAVYEVACPEGIAVAGMYVLVFPLEGRTMPKYKEAVKRFIRTRMTGIVLDEKDTTVAGYPAWEITYEGKGIGYVRGDRRYLRAVFIARGKLYVLHCVALVDRFERYESAFREMIASARLEAKKEK